jgi:hypothetical protein
VVSSFVLPSSMSTPALYQTLAYGITNDFVFFEPQEDVEQVLYFFLRQGRFVVVLTVAGWDASSCQCSIIAVSSRDNFGVAR